MIPMVTAPDVVFWICGPLAVLAAVGLVMFRKAVYSALSLAFLMLNLAAIYASLQAPFLAAVQVIVYTGAIMMLFLFVLMLVGVDRPDSFVETIKGHKIIAGIAALGTVGLIVFGVGQAVVGAPVGLDGTNGANVANGGNVEGIAALIFSRYVFAFELTSALLITAAVGAMVLAQNARLRPKVTQKDRAAARIRAYATQGTHPGSLPNSGVLALHNSIGTPALLPDGTVSPASVSQVLVERDAIVDTKALATRTTEAFGQIEAVAHDKEDE